jgi:ATP-binding protein involved in chromosome partitioning
MKFAGNVGAHRLGTPNFALRRGMLTFRSIAGGSIIYAPSGFSYMPTPQEILAELKKVRYPGFTRDIVSFGIIKDVEVAQPGVTVVLAATPSTKPETIAQISADIERTIGAMAGVPAIKVEVEQAAPPRAAAATLSKRTIPGVEHVVAVASGKGGVGKSTVAVNLALAIAALGMRTGLMDADVYGPSVAMMVGAGHQVRVTPQRRIVPLERFGLRYISMALFVGDETAVIWRGPMVTKLESEFLFNVEWGNLDYLVLDLPPGTGDAQLTITQRVVLDGGVIVTTPQEIALLDVKRGVAMFQQVEVPVLGVVENMSYYLCGKCGHRHEIFAHGGGAHFARELNVPFLGEIPMVRQIREGGDTATPIVVAEPGHPVSTTFKTIAATIIARLAESATHERA